MAKRTGGIKWKGGITKKSMQNYAKNTKTITKVVEDASVQALFLGGLLIQRESQKVVPWKTGTLSGSSYTQVKKDPKGFYVVVGYRTEYAITVHENLDPNVKWSKPGTGPKYLERPLRDNSKKVQRLVKEHIAKKIKAKGDME